MFVGAESLLFVLCSSCITPKGKRSLVQDRLIGTPAECIDDQSHLPYLRALGSLEILI